jgi:hypothetical protein
MAMDFDDLLSQVLVLLQREKRVGCNSHIDVRLFPGGHLTQ